MSVIAQPPVARRVTLAHGGGGKAMRDLIDEVFLTAFRLGRSEGLEDQARLVSSELAAPGAKLAFTTDSFVVDPIEFPGGDIGKIAVCGTITDLAVGGARPLWLSAAFIIEEGTDIGLLHRIAASMQAAADAAGVTIVTGDTKVVGSGSADQVFVTTSGIGVIPVGRELAANNVGVGDIAIVNGGLGDHGAAILAARSEMAITADIRSDCQPLNHLMEAVLSGCSGVRAARDATRGGLASALNEMAAAAQIGIEIEETSLPLRAEVKGVCEILGLDPLYLANEGTLVLFAAPQFADDVLDIMRAHPAGRNARIIGKATGHRPGMVVMNTIFGGGRIVDMLVGEQLPRIC